MGRPVPSVAPMRRRPSPDHQEAVSRRLALLSAELAAVRGPEAVEPEAFEAVAVEQGAGDPWGGDPGKQGEDDDWTAPHTRIAARRAPLYAVPGPEVRPEVPTEARPEPLTEPPPSPTSVRMPGRHAARRPRRLLADAVPATLRGRVALGSSHVAVLAVLVAVGLALTCWWVVRGRPHEVVAPVVAGSAAALASLPPTSTQAATAPAALAAGPAGSSPGAGDSGATVTVDVAGRVRRPGIAVLDAGSRVVDALEAAGGARPGVDLSGLNLARVLVDGEQILVGVPGAGAIAAPAGAATGAMPPGAASGPLVNLNTATEAELEELPEVGPVPAQSIISWRDEHGGFTSVDELLEVDGIGDATLSKLAPLVTV